MGHQCPAARVEDILVRFVDTSNQNVDSSNIFFHFLNGPSNRIFIQEITLVSEYHRSGSRRFVPPLRSRLDDQMSLLQSGYRFLDRFRIFVHANDGTTVF